MVNDSVACPLCPTEPVLWSLCLVYYSACTGAGRRAIAVLGASLRSGSRRKPANSCEYSPSFFVFFCLWNALFQALFIRYCDVFRVKLLSNLKMSIRLVNSLQGTVRHTLQWFISRIIHSLSLLLGICAHQQHSLCGRLAKNEFPCFRCFSLIAHCNGSYECWYVFLHRCF